MKFYNTPEWFLFLSLLWMTLVSSGVGIWSLNDVKLGNDPNFPRINYWIHLIPVFGFFLGLYMLFTNKPLIKSEPIQLTLMRQKQLSPIARLFLLVQWIFQRSP